MSYSTSLALLFLFLFRVKKIPILSFDVLPTKSRLLIFLLLMIASCVLKEEQRGKENAIIALSSAIYELLPYIAPLI